MALETSKFQTLSSFCQNDSFQKIKVALLTFYKIQYSPLIEKLILIIEYLQLMAQALLASSLIYGSPQQSPYFFQIVIYVFKLIHPSHLLSFENSDSMTSTVLVVLFCGTLLKLTLFANVIYASIRKTEMNSWLLFGWRWIYKFQTRVLYFLFTSFWVKAIRKAQEQEFSPFGMAKYSVFSVSSLMIAFEFGLSYIFETQFCYFLPSKNFLSAKNNKLEIMTFLQKFIIQIEVLCISSDSEAHIWIACVIGIIVGLIKYYEFFMKLPLYHFEALMWQGGLLVTVLSLNIAYFVNNILRESEYGVVGINFVIITWILLALLTNKISYDTLKIQILYIVSEKNNYWKTPELLVHKVIATKELKRRERIPAETRSDFAFSHLVSTQQNVNLQEIFGLDLRDVLPAKLDSENLSEEVMNKIYLKYFEDLLKKDPKNFLIKLHTAYRCLKNSESFTKTMMLVSEIQQGKWSKNYLSCSLLFHEIERSILASCIENQEQQTLDLFAYLKTRLLMEDLRSSMVTQTDFQLKACNNILNEVSNFGEIYDSAQKIHKLRVAIEKKISKFSETLSEYYVSPFLTYAEYSLVANHSATHFEKYYETYIQKYSLRVQKFMKEPGLIPENLYQDSNAFLLMSTWKADYRKILFCNKALVDLCGGQNAKTYQGSDISRVFPYFLSEYYNELYKKAELTGDKGFINKVHRAYVYHQNHHLVEVDFYMKYHPYLAQGLCINLILRPVPVIENTGFLLLTEAGDIIGASKEVSKLLNLNSRGSHNGAMISVKAISDQLYEMNEAFNTISKYQTAMKKVPTLSARHFTPRRISKVSQGMFFFNEYEKANEIYTNFTSEDQQVQLYPCEDKRYEEPLSKREINEPNKFYARVQILDLGNIQIKQISLRLIKPNEQNSKKTLIKLENKEEDEEIEEDYFVPTSTERIQTTRYYFNSASQIPTSRSKALLTERPLKAEEDEEEIETEIPEIPQRSTRRKRGHTEIALPTSGSDLHKEENSIRHHHQKRKAAKYVSSTNHQFRSMEKVEDRVYKSAILSKAYPKSFRGLCLLFYLVLALTFAGQTVMLSISENTMNDLQVKKNLLKDSEERAYKGALIQINARGIVDQFAGKYQAGGVISGLARVIVNLQQRMNDMSEANHKMLEMVDSLDKKAQEHLFVADIQINGNYLDGTDGAYRYMNAFQVTDETTNAIKTLKNMNTTENPTLTLNIFTFLADNLIDDFLYKTQEISTILAESVEEQKESLQNLTNLFLTLNPLLLMSIGILLTGIILNQYRIENTNMKAFIKIPPKEVKSIANRLTQFKRDLLNEETFEKKYTSTNNIDTSSQIVRISVYSKSSDIHKIQYKEFRKRYYKYISKVILCILALDAIAIWDSIITRQSIKVIYNRQNQLQFANFISNRITVTAMTYAQLFYTNNTVKVEGHYPFDSLPILSEMTRQIQSEIPQQFLEVDGTYNPEVQSIIFMDDPDCSGWTSDFLLYCNALVSKGQPVNMMVAIAAFQNIIENKIQDFIEANKTTLGSILEADGITPNPLPNFMAIVEEAHRIADIMDESMTEKITEMQRERGIIITIFSFGLLVVGILIWFSVLKVIREVYNDFKKVLQIFPANLVLSSYLLKRFLQQSSNGPLLK